MKTLLKNRFDFTNYLTGFVDRHSHMVVTVSRDYLGINAVCPRGLSMLRETLTSPSFRWQLSSDEYKLPASITVNELETYPWGAVQSGFYTAGRGRISAKSTLVCPEHNVYVMDVTLDADDAIGGPMRLTLDGQLAELFTEATIEEKHGSIIFAVLREDEQSSRLHRAELDFVPCWRLTVPGRRLKLKRNGDCCYSIDVGPISVSRSQRVQMILEVENRPASQRTIWSAPPNLYDAEQSWRSSEQRWLDMLENLEGKERPSLSCELRAACVLDRCGYLGKHGHWGDDVGSLCMVTSWAATAFFWDSVFGALGLAEFDLRQAEGALATLFAFQREDGCVPTHSYECMIGSTFYPQAPIVSWATLRMFRRYRNIDFVKAMLPKMRLMFDWVRKTQDQDGDGLVEIRFTGQLADNAPQYDRYISHVNPRPDCWNVFLPPVASPAWNSFHYMDARALAELYKITGDRQAAKTVMEQVARIPERLMEVCWDRQTEYFQDYDHQIREFNRAHVLTGALPLWAGMPLDKSVCKTVIEEHLLNPKSFFGEYPLPYLAYDDANYTPQGYWRGRVWPHTTTWILELLWQFGYEKQADEIADRLLKMMNQQECVLENYHSNPACPGGGSPDYQWSSASYLYLMNRRYRENIFE